MTHEQLLSELWKDAEKILTQPLADALPQSEVDAEKYEQEINENVCAA
jgi:hypothetical protein